MKIPATIIVHPGNEDKYEALKVVFKALKIKFEVLLEKPYDSDFVAKIQESKNQYKKGDYSVIKTDDLWK